MHLVYAFRISALAAATCMAIRSKWPKAIAWRDFGRVHWTNAANNPIACIEHIKTSAWYWTRDSWMKTVLVEAQHSLANRVCTPQPTTLGWIYTYFLALSEYIRTSATLYQSVEQIRPEFITLTKINRLFKFKIRNHAKGDTVDWHLLGGCLQFGLCVGSFLCFLQIFTIFIAVVVTVCLAQRPVMRFRNKSNSKLITFQIC